MKRLQTAFLAVACICASTGTATAQSVDGGSPAVLSVDTKADGWRVSLDGMRPEAIGFLYLGLPNMGGAPVRVDLGFFGHFDLDVLYPVGPILVGVPDGAGHADVVLARPVPMPVELLGYKLALQGVEATFQHFFGDAKGDVQTVARYRPTAAVTFLLR